MDCPTTSTTTSSRIASPIAPGYRESYERERDLLYQARRETDAGRRRTLVGEAVAAMQRRRADYFTGADAVFAQLDDIFLGMEGLGQFAGYRSAVRDGLSDARAVELMRRGGVFWSQDLGLAALLAVDATLPGWPRRALGVTGPGVLDLLTAAAGGDGRSTAAD